MTIEADAGGMAVHCERIRKELAVRALTEGRNGGLDAGGAEHLGRCADCATEQDLLAEVTQVLSHVGLRAFEGIPAPGCRR
ncbi:hypothetical protein [Streptomyces sp. NPDC058632]|uniref:hypothetical protein n=1 Tax=unclassified Streptomyces TaxID=2593676 RepID=UPI00365FEE34